MTESRFKKFVLPSVLLSAGVFSALTLPLAVFGSQPVTIQLQDKQVFHGQLRDVAMPYLGLAGALSLGAGIATVAVTGWQLSTRKSVAVELQLSGLEQNLKEKEELLEQLKLSKSRLETTGLSAFLDDEVKLEQALSVPVAMKSEPSVVRDTPVPVVEPLVTATQPVETQPIISSKATRQAAVARFASAQIFLGYAQPIKTIKVSSKATSLTPSEVEQLHSQLQQIKAQMASLQTALSCTPQAATSEIQVPTPTDVEAQLQVLQSWSVHKMAS